MMKLRQRVFLYGVVFDHGHTVRRPLVWVSSGYHVTRKTPFLNVTLCGRWHWTLYPEQVTTAAGQAERDRMRTLFEEKRRAA